MRRPRSNREGIMNRAVHLNLDNAWDVHTLGLPRRDALAWGPRMRYHATPALIEAFGREVADELPPFVLYGSGDFHHLSGALLFASLRRGSAPVTLVSFDNHPDWDVRPPKWG